MPIQKVKIVTTLLVEADTPDQAQSYLSSMTLARLGDEIDQGDAVGQTEVGLGETIPMDRVKDECEALGSDQSCFGHLFEGETA
jgi:hypothetical protein